jgi:hypothetical protein
MERHVQGDDRFDAVAATPEVTSRPLRCCHAESAVHSHITFRE